MLIWLWVWGVCSWRQWAVFYWHSGEAFCIHLLGRLWMTGVQFPAGGWYFVITLSRPNMAALPTSWAVGIYLEVKEVGSSCWPLSSMFCWVRSAFRYNSTVACYFFFHLLIRLHSLVLKGGYTLVTLRRAVTPYRDSVDGTRDHVTYQK